MQLNKTYNEDCLVTMKEMPDDFVDIIITSPPYNIGTSRINGGYKKKEYDTYNDNISKEEYFKKTKMWIDEMIRVTKYHVFYNVQEVSGNKGIIAFILRNYSNIIKETFIWAKTNPQSSIVDTMCSSGYEYIFCFSKDNPESRKFNYCNFSNRNGDYMKNIIIKSVNSGKENAGHSFSFGDWLPNFFINNFSKEGDIIYDPFMGSGTTAKSAIIYSRKWIGSEISKKYVDITNKRIIPYISQKTLF